MRYITEMPALPAEGNERESIKITPEASSEMEEFLSRDVANTIGPSEFIRQSVRMWREMKQIDLEAAERELEQIVDYWRNGSDDMEGYRDDDRENFPALTTLRDALFGR